MMTMNNFIQIHERQLKPLIDEGFSGPTSRMGLTESLRCLEFAQRQCEVNEQRREKLVKAADPDWEPPCTDVVHIDVSPLFSLFLCV